MLVGVILVKVKSALNIYLYGVLYFVVENSFVLDFVARLDLDKWINEPPSESSEEEEEIETIFDTTNEHR